MRERECTTKCKVKFTLSATELKRSNVRNKMTHYLPTLIALEMWIKMAELCKNLVNLSFRIN